MTPAETSAERYPRELAVDVSLSHGTTLRGRPSQYHANITRLLEMHTLECTRHIESIIDRNPYIELDDEFACYSIDRGEPVPADEGEIREVAHREGDYNYFGAHTDVEQEELVGPSEDFTETLPLYLRTQTPAFTEKGQDVIWNALIDFLDNRGFITETPENIARSVGCHKEEVLVVLELLGTVEPGGIGSTGVTDFIRFQYRNSGWAVSDAERTIIEHLDGLKGGKPGDLCRKLGLSETEMREAMDTISEMRPYPTWGLSFESAAAPEPEAAPDFVYYTRTTGDPILGVVQPGVKINLARHGKEIDPHAAAGHDKGTREWSLLNRNLEREALELEELIAHRKQTILRVASSILEIQKAFISEENDHKEPLTVSQIAASLGLPVSTVSRAMKNRTVATPRGTFFLKELLSRPVSPVGDTGVSCDYVQRRIKDLHERADGKRRSDMEISDMLKSEGIDIARRTVNKYRRQALERT
jgi:RNA polymerase sigma-54 factor